MKELNSDSIINPLIELYSKSRNDSVIQFRFLELFHHLKVSNDELNYTFFSDIKSLITDSSDVLLSVNGLQIIQDCIERREQFDLFVNEGIIEIIIKKYIENNEKENDVLICKSLDLLAHCALLKCFDYNFIQLNGLERIVISLSDSSFNESIRVSSLICAAALATLSPNPEIFLNSYETFLINETSSIQLAAIHGLGVYFSSQNQSNQLKYNFLLYLSSNIKNLFIWLKEKINSTFDEQKSAAYFALKSIISIPENFKFVLDHSTLISTILQRNSDDSMVGLKWKYGIIEQIYEK